MTPTLPRLHLPRRPVLGALLGTLLVAAPAGCTTWPAPTVPMPVRRIAARCAASARCVLLPGAYSRADDFVSEGFVLDLQRSAPGCELLLADAHLGYFIEGQLLRRLREDVVRPGMGDAPGEAHGAGQQGDRVDARPWLVGVSLGGMAALAYAMRHGSEIAGVLAIAPYLGRRELMRDITAAGGPLHWSRLPAVAREPHESIEDELWRWLVRPGIGSVASGLPIYLGYGRADRFAETQQMLRALLPADHGDIVDGGHDWPPWRALWQRWLQRGLLLGVGCGSTA